jgi:paraquat-inducible protein B
MWAKRVGWLALIWLLSVCALALVAWLIRQGMQAAGMHS